MPDRTRQAPTQSGAPFRRRLATAGWLLAAIAIVLARRSAPAAVDEDGGPRPLLAPPGDGPAAVSSAPPVARHDPVEVVGEWWHTPVVVLAPADSARHPDLPRPFAALRGFASPLIMPRLRLPRVLDASFPALRALAARARPGEPVSVTLTAYCLHGTTRKGTQTRAGIAAADPRIFPLLRHVEVYAAGRYLGRFHIEDTGGAVHGTHLDLWTPDCADAERFGTRPGVASLVALGQ